MSFAQAAPCRPPELECLRQASADVLVCTDCFLQIPDAGLMRIVFSF